MRKSSLAVVALAAAASLSAFAVPGFAQVQKASASTVASPADVAGSWRGFGLQTGTDTMIVIKADGGWTTKSKYGSESGKGTIKEGAFHLEWKGGYGKMDITPTSAGITAMTTWYNGTKWINGQVNATRCQKDDCSERGAFTK